MSRYYIGTSGWAYKEWGEKFFPQDLPRREHLRYLAGKFNTVEINSTFYRLQPEHNYELWREQTPNGFKMAIKVSRFITHRKEPIDPTEPWRRLAEPSRRLGQKRGPFLFQFPPSFRLDNAWLDWFDKYLPYFKKTEPTALFAVELRHKDAFREEAMARLEKHGLALVVANSSRFPTAPHPGWAGYCYYRFHGPRDLFSSDYSEEELAPWARQIKRNLKAGKDIYAYFNNDFHAYAPGNAQLLISLLSLNVPSG